MKIYLDTRIILRLFGLEGEYREKSYINFLKLLKDHKAKIFIFEHTYEEIKGIIEDCYKWLENPNYNPSLASPVLRYFVENNYLKSDVDLFLAKLDSFLRFHQISIKEKPDYNLNQQYLIDESKLTDIIKSTYNNTYNTYENCEKEIVIQKDVFSISSIYLIRKGKKPDYIKKAKGLFLTTNNSLVIANSEFNKQLSNNYKIQECLSDVFLGTFMWFDNPIEFFNFQEKKILANCVCNLNPNDILIKKYINKLNKLEKDKNLTPDVVYYLKTNKDVWNILSEKTFNDENNFSDKLPEEIIEEIKNKFASPIINELDKEKDSNKLLQKKYDKLEENKKQTIENIEKIAKGITNILLYFITPITSIFFAYIIIASYFTESSSIRLTAGSISIIMAFTGISIIGFIKKIKIFLLNKITNTLKNLFLFDNIQ